MTYRENSNWDDKNEIHCMVIFKKLTEKNSTIDKKQADYCREMALLTNLNAVSISAKISNYKSVAGINYKSHYSQNTKRIYKKYKNYSIEDLEKLIDIKV